jgi:ABC-type antimicrobial peptide transport system permease subunit
VIAYTVRQRRREIAVRMAIGADRRTITALFVRHGLVTLGAGLTLGVAGAVALGSVLRSQLFGVNVSDPKLLTVVTCAFAVCGLLAVVWPASTAASVDPAEALKD